MSQDDLEFLNYIESSTKAIKLLEDQKSSLQTKLAEVNEQRVILEKVASQPTFNPEKLRSTLELMSEKRFIDSDYKEKVASIIEENPERILELLEKIANHAIHECGRSISRDRDTNMDDPDGWQKVKTLKH